jgi:uncharacterized protein (TIGR00266 family)
MDVEILHRPGSSAAHLTLGGGETCTAEAGAMISMSGNMDVETTTHKKGKGGILKAMKRLLSGESFFLNHYTAPDEGGEVVLSAALAGDMICCDLSADALIVQAGSYVASEKDVEMDMGWQGFKSFLSGESAFWLKITGPGKVVINSFGAIYPIDVEDEHIVDTGHIVAFDDTLSFQITKAAKGWFNSFLGGEGLVCRFSGRGRIWVQSHNASSFGATLGPMLRPRS